MRTGARDWSTLTEHYELTAFSRLIGHTGNNTLVDPKPAHTLDAEGTSIVNCEATRTVGRPWIVSVDIPRALGGSIGLGLEGTEIWS